MFKSVRVFNLMLFVTLWCSIGRSQSAQNISNHEPIGIKLYAARIMERYGAPTELIKIDSSMFSLNGQTFLISGDLDGDGYLDIFELEGLITWTVDKNSDQLIDSTENSWLVTEADIQPLPGKSGSKENEHFGTDNGKIKKGIADAAQANGVLTGKAPALPVETKIQIDGSILELKKNQPNPLFQEWQSKKYGYSFSIANDYKLASDSVKPGYSEMLFRNGNKAGIVIIALTPAGYDSASNVNAMPQMAALTPAAWKVELPKSYPGAKFEKFSLLEIGRRPAYRLDYGTGRGENVKSNTVVCVYSRLHIYILQSVSPNIDSFNLVTAFQDMARFDALLESFRID